jgi:hypothetical protein
MSDGDERAAMRSRASSELTGTIIEKCSSAAKSISLCCLAFRAESANRCTVLCALNPPERAGIDIRGPETQTLECLYSFVDGPHTSVCSQTCQTCSLIGSLDAILLLAPR